MPVIYQTSSASGSLIPAPFVSINKSYVRNELGEILRPEFNISLRGTIVNVNDSQLDSPNAKLDNGITDGASMMGTLAEQNRIRQLFNEDGGRLYISTPVGSGSYDYVFYPQILSVDFEPSTWTQRCDYNISMRAVTLAIDNDDVEELNTASENWNVVENQDGTFSISHQLQAVGALMYSSSGVNNPLTIARRWCEDRRRGITTSGFIVPPGTTSGVFWNYSCIEGAGITNGSWQLTENFLCFPSGNVREEFIANVNFESNNPRFASITINGNIYGYADRLSNLSLRNERARNYYNVSVSPNIYTRLSGFIPAGYSLSPIPITKQISYENPEGLVRYAHTYQASSGNMIPNAITESVSVVDLGETDIFALIPVPGRANGPVVQPMETVSLPERTVTITATLISDTTPITASNLRSMYLSKPNTNAFIEALIPSSGYYYIKQDSEEWGILTRQYSRVVSWTIQTEGVSVSGIPTTVNNLGP